MYTNLGCNKYTYILSWTTVFLFFEVDLACASGASSSSSSSSSSSVAAGLAAGLTVGLTVAGLAAGLTVPADLQYVY